MKTKKYLSLMALAIAFGSCTNDLEDKTNSFMGNGDVIAVTMGDADSRTAMNDNNVIWSAEDAIGVFMGSTNNEYVLQGEGGTTSGNFQSKGLVVASAETLKEAAYFPYVQGATWDKTKKEITTTLPATYPYAEGTNNNAVMAALMSEDNQSSISFQNAGALYAITIENIPAGYDNAVMTYLGTDDQVGIAGAATITFADGLPTLAVLDATDATSAQKTITITSIGTGSKTFYFPMPIKTENGYAGKLQFSLQGTNKEPIEAPVFTKEPARSTLYSVTFKLDGVSGGIVTEVENIAAANTELAKDVVTSVTVKDVSGSTAISIPAKSTESAAVAHTIDLSEATLPTTGSVEIVVTEGTGEKATVENLTVIVPDGASAGSYNINAPGTTVTIQAADGTVIETIEAITAENTLIIAEGVTVNKLVLKGGNVRNSGTINSIVDTYNNEYTWVTNLDGLKAAITAGNNIILGADITSTGIITINRTLTLNGNGYKLTSSADRAINIETENNVTIKNLTVEASGERAFNVINQPATLTLDNVTATAKNNAVMVATSAGAATLDIKNSKLTGAATINIAGAGTTAKITDTDIESIDNSAKEGYAAINFHNTANNATVTVTGGSITLSGTQVGDDSFAGYSSANGTSITFNGDITFDGVTEENKIGSSACYIPYSNQTAYGFQSLEEALDWTKGGETIVLSEDLVLTSTLEITKDVTIDLNGKSLTNNVNKARAFKLSADGVSFTLKATGANITFGNGTYGMIEIASGVDGATVNVNGGTFDGTTDCGAFVKFRDGNNNTVSLTDVTYTEKCELQEGDTNAWVISKSTGTGNKLTVSGGTYNVACGFGLDKFTSTFDGVTITAKGIGMEIAGNTSTVEGCTITVDPGKPVNNIHASCIAASTQSVVTVVESTIKAGENAYALYVLPTGGTINVDSKTTITGTEYMHDPMENGCTGAINKEEAAQ